MLRLIKGCKDIVIKKRLRLIKGCKDIGIKKSKFDKTKVAKISGLKSQSLTKQRLLRYQD